MEGTVVIRVIEVVDRSTVFPPETYVQAYTPDGHKGRGDLVLTPRIADAKVFANAAEALAEWKRTSATHPRRPDGRPNRPMTAFTVAIEKAA
jgi:hypothetical protein